jgi:hypothetical protein
MASRSPRIDPPCPHRRRVRALSILLGSLAVILFAGNLIGRLPHEPRLYLVNERLGTFGDRVIHSACGDIEIPPLGEGESVRLALVPRPGCEYVIDHTTLQGDEMIRLMELARQEKTDVKIEVGIDYVRADLW